LSQISYEFFKAQIFNDSFIVTWGSGVKCQVIFERLLINSPLERDLYYRKNGKKEKKNGYNYSRPIACII
jgi:hypothetical protein